MYRYGDGTPFPLEENFIETLTAAVEACTNAFMPLTELDGRRERARAGRAEADRELARLTRCARVRPRSRVCPLRRHRQGADDGSAAVHLRERQDERASTRRRPKD